MKINGFDFLPPQAQIYKNASDIQELKANQFILYKTSNELTNESVSEDRANTNVPEDINYGYLIDPNGLLFKINGGDENTLLLEYYSLLTIVGA